jgi:hypothetical protein
MLNIDMDYMYFLKRLSRRGEPILFSGHQSTPWSIEAYVVQYFIPWSCLVGGRIVIK